MLRNTGKATTIGLLALALGGVAAGQTRAEVEAAVHQAVEYERDVPKAIRLLEEARERALKSRTPNHPDVVAIEARLKSLRTGGRGASGESVVQDPASKPTAPGRSFERRAWDLVTAAANDAGWNESVERGVAGHYLQQAALLGAPIVPSLLRLLDGEPLLSPEGANRIAPPRVVAELLAAITGPEADAAVAAAFESPDPVLRRAIIAALDPTRHRAILERLLADEATPIYGFAVSALSRTSGNDEKAAEILRRVARTGNSSAWKWLVRHRRAEAIAMMVDPSTPQNVRASYARDLGRAYPPLTAGDLESLLKSTSSAADAALDEALVGVMNSVLGTRDGKAELMKIRELAETWLIDRIGVGLSVASSDVVQAWTPLATRRSLPKLETIFAAGKFQDQRFGSGTFDPYNHLAPVVQSITQGLSPADFRSLIGDLGLVSPRACEPGQVGVASAILSILDTAIRRHGDSPEATSRPAELLAGLAEPHRRWFLEVYALYQLNGNTPTTAGALPAQTVFATTLLALNGDIREEKQGGMSAIAPNRAGQERPAEATATALNFLRRSGIWSAPGTATAENFGRIAGFAAAQGPSVRSGDALPLSTFGGRAVEALQAAAAEGHAALVEAAVRPYINDVAEGKAGAQRYGLLRALPEAARFDAVAALLAKEADATRRLALLDLLLEIRHPGVAPRVVEEWKAGRLTTARLRRRSVAVFESTLHQPALELLRDALTDDDGEVREAAQKAFATFKKNREALQELDEWKRGDAERSDAVAELVRLLDHEKTEVVIGAVRSLGALKAKAALPKLVKLLETPNDALRSAINEAIVKIGS